MWLWIIAAILILIVVITIRKNVKTAKLNRERNIPLINETIDKLKLIEAFSNLPDIKDEGGRVMIIPVNSEGDIYNRFSDRLTLMLLLHDDDIYFISLCASKTDIASSFSLTKKDNSLFYVSTTYNTLHGEYKKFMPQLNDAVRRAFPNVKFEFDGSRVMADHM